MTVLEVIKRSADFLGKRGVESPRLQVELLLSHLLAMPRMKLYLNFERALTEKELEDLRKMVTRRGQREPLQHITGWTSFCGLEMTVNSAVLVPRPETELLAELAWEFLNAEVGKLRISDCGLRIREMAPPYRVGKLGADKGPAKAGTPNGEKEPHKCGTPNGEGISQERGTPNREGRPQESGTPNGEENAAEAAITSGMSALDFGTGSGCLAIALAMKCPQAAVTAIDVSAAALAVAKQNAKRHQVESRIRFMEGDGWTAVPRGERFDLIVTNPPYIPSAEIATLDAEVRDHDPRLALDGGADGLDFYRRLAEGAAAFLKLGGRIMMEFGDGQEGAVQKLFEGQGWVVEAVKEDYSGKPRILVARS